MKRLWYNFQQFLGHFLSPPLTPAAQEAVFAHLNPAQQQLFRQFSYGDQWHSYRVMCTLQAAGHTHPDLITAALLHDIGKIKTRFTAFDRSFEALVRKLLPKQAQKWENLSLQQCANWQKPFLVRAQHPHWSGELVNSTAASPLTLNLIRRHQDKLLEILTEEDQLLAYLQWADDQN